MTELVKTGPKKTWRYAAVCLAATLLLVAAVQLRLGIRYEVNDDAILSNILAGAYGGERWRLVYVNILVGFVLGPLYGLLPGLNWFVAALVGGGVLCFTLLGVQLFARLGPKRAAVPFGLLLVLGGADFFARFHYVKYGGLFLVTGLVLILLNLGRLNPASLGGMALVFAGSLLRFDMLPAIGGLAAGLLVLRFVRLDRAARLRTLAMAAGLLALVCAAKAADWYTYRADPGWAHYTRFNAARTQISDFKLQFAGEEDFAALGYSANDYTIVDDWAYYDPAVFPLEAVEGLAQDLPGNTAGGALRAGAYHAGRLLHTKPEHVLLAVVLAAWVFLSGKRRWPALALTLSAFAAELLYLNYRGRYPQRIDSILVLALAILCALCIEDVKELKPRFTGFAAAVLLLGMAPTFAASLAAADDYWASRPPHAAQFDALAQDTDTLYLVDTVLVDAANGYSVWHARGEGYFSNMVFVGSWLMYAPPQQQALAAYGVENPYADALDNANVRFADYYHRAAKEIYLQEHYDPTARLVLEAEYREMNIYRAETGQ